MQPARIAVLLAATAAAATVHAQAIWRCGDSYSQQPCTGGTQVAAPAAPSAADRAQANAATSRDARLADSLEKQRLQREAQAATAPQVFSPTQADTTPEGYKTPEKKATRKLDVFTATVPGSGKAAKKSDDKGKKHTATARPEPAAIGPAAKRADDKSPGKSAKKT